MEGKEATILTSIREGGAKERGVGDLEEDDLEELDAAVNAFIQFPELGTETFEELTINRGVKCLLYIRRSLLQPSTPFAAPDFASSNLCCPY